MGYEKLQIFIWKLQLGRWVHTKYTLIFFTCLLPLFHNQYYRTFKIGFKGIIQVFDEQKILSPKSHQNSKTCLKNRHCWIPAAIAVTKGFPLSRVNVLASNKKGRMAPILTPQGVQEIFLSGEKFVNCMHFGHLFLQKLCAALQSKNHSVGHRRKSGYHWFMVIRFHINRHL